MVFLKIIPKENLIFTKIGLIYSLCKRLHKNIKKNHNFFVKKFADSKKTSTFAVY